MTAGDSSVHPLLQPCSDGCIIQPITFLPTAKPLVSQPSTKGGIGMEPKGFHRKLTAILSADVVGYSRLMQDDEAATVKTLESYKRIISDLVRQHRGRVVDSPGDNLLAEFASVVDAVQCAVAVQKELQARNAELPENRRMLFRIGVNLGDVIEEESRIYGDGVNIAARLESLADPGGICVSKTAFDQIETKLPFGYIYLGEQKVKNIAKAVGAYKVLMEPRVTKDWGAGIKPKRSGQRMAIIGLAVLVVIIAGAALWQFFSRHTAPDVEMADLKQMKLSLPEQPSIAVLPFMNLSQDPKQELLCDGITDNIINALSKVKGLFVIARNSILPYKGKTVKAKQVSEQLGVRYVLEGSLQQSGDQLRITAEMVDAITGKQVLFERYDGEPTKVFAAQDDITMKVLGSIMKWTNQSVASEWMIYYKDAHGLDCFLKYQEGVRFLRQMTLAGAKQAQQIAEEGLAICPENPSLNRLLVSAYINYYWYDTTRPPQESINKATELLQKILAQDSNNAWAHAYLCFIYLHKREYDNAIAEGELAASLDPGSPDRIKPYAKALCYAGKPQEAIPLLEKILRLDPMASPTTYNDLGMAYRMTGRYEEAAAKYKKSIEMAPNDSLMHAALAVVYIMMGRDEEARAEAAETMRINPRFSLEWYSKISLIKDRSVLKQNIEAMRKAGLPDKSPSAPP
jgi:adenylate cyclase